MEIQEQEGTGSLVFLSLFFQPRCHNLAVSLHPSCQPPAETILNPSHLISSWMSALLVVTTAAGRGRGTA